MAEKLRLDVSLVSLGLCESREQARRLILAGEVTLNGHRADKASVSVKPGDKVDVKTRPKYVSRGGLKLEGALRDFGLDVTGLTCLDVGASTGGFTDCLLQAGATRVYAYDVGTNQLVWKLRNDPRVISREQFNVRHMEPEDIPEMIDLAVFDVSFISLNLLIKPVAAVLRPDTGQIICLIKPQFELGREEVTKAAGIIRDPILHEQAVAKVRRFIDEETNLQWRNVIPSPITGTDGNTEFLAWITHSTSAL
jgi:23S rRNA (cytidine1920-2'-O)/16S rRNA (cytidine1409-2'-O)-methyltransferase